MRYLFLVLPVLVIDWLTFQALQLPLSALGGSASFALSVLFWAIPLLSLLHVAATENGWNRFLSRKTTVAITAVIVILYFSKLLTGMVILIDDVRRAGAWLITASVPGVDLITARLPVMSKIGLVLGSVPALLLIYGLIRNPYRYKLFRHEIRLPSVPDALDGLKIVQISDIHAGSLLEPDRVRKSVELINGLEPDLVFFTGDLVNHTADEIDPLIDVFSAIKARHGVYSIVGNHDYGDYVRWPDRISKEANFEKLKQNHARLGWDLLLNDHRHLTIRDVPVAVIGVENYSAHPRFPKYGDLERARHGMKSADLVVLLSHDPTHWDAEVITNHPDVDLTLSGHTHGFQFGIEIGNFFRWSPVQYVYRRWAGLYRSGRQYLYINRGLGFLGYPGRVGILPEVTLLTLRAGT